MADQIYLKTPEDLERHGLREFSRYSTPSATAAGFAQLASLRKYYEPGDPWRRWVGVDALIPTSDYKGQRPVIGGLSLDPRPGVLRPHIFLNQAPGLPEMTNEHAARALSAMGWHVPSNRPEAYDAAHEGMHTIAEFAITIDVITYELEDRVSTVLGTPWYSTDEHSPEAAAKIAATLSRYAADEPSEFLAEALVEWNEFGYGSSPLAIAVGSTIDRYLTRSQGALEVLSERTTYLDLCFSMPEALAAMFTKDDPTPDKWLDTYDEYYDAIESGRPVPMPRFERLDLNGKQTVVLYAPSTPSRWTFRSESEQLVPNNFSAGGIDSDLAQVMPLAALGVGGVIVKRPLGIAPAFEIDTSAIDPQIASIAFKSSAQLLAEHAEAARELGVAIPDSWQLPTLQAEHGGPGFGR